MPRANRHINSRKIIFSLGRARVCVLLHMDKCMDVFSIVSVNKIAFQYVVFYRLHKFCAPRSWDSASLNIPVCDFVVSPSTRRNAEKTEVDIGKRFPRVIFIENLAIAQMTRGLFAGNVKITAYVRCKDD